MKKLVFAVLLVCAAACSRRPATVTVLHFNDVYEIDAVENGHAGGLARVATVRAGLLKAAEPLITTLGGDFLSPSAIGTAKIDGQPLAGQQMVEVLNTVGVDYATFGNHEFDVSEAAFHQRLSEQKFALISSNVTDATGQPFAGTVQVMLVQKQVAGRQVQLCVIGLTIDANKKPWVTYLEPIEAARKQIDGCRKRAPVDAVIALTHLSLAQDQALVTAVPDIDVVLGGHEHENWIISRGPHLTPIVKADANVRSVAIVTVGFEAREARPTVSARLEIVDDRVAADPVVEAIVKKWESIAFDAFKKDGFSPESIVATTTEPLDGRESTVRNHSGALTDIIAAAMLHEAGQPAAAVFNGGSVRIDDVIPPGPIRQYDIIRVLPFGGKVLKATVDGALLNEVLDTGVKNQGTGGYLQTAGITREGARWMIQGKPINPGARYVVAINEFLLTGGEANLSFLTRTNPRVKDVQEFRDVRQAVITELQTRYK